VYVSGDALRTVHLAWELFLRNTHSTRSFPNTDALLTETPDLREYVPDRCRDLLDMEANDLRSEIPALAHDKERMGEVEQAVKSCPRITTSTSATPAISRIRSRTLPNYQNLTAIIAH